MSRTCHGQVMEGAHRPAPRRYLLESVKFHVGAENLLYLFGARARSALHGVLCNLLAARTSARSVRSAERLDATE